jgi:hypothetical protein
MMTVGMVSDCHAIKKEAVSDALEIYPQSNLRCNEGERSNMVWLKHGAQTQKRMEIALPCAFK